MFDLQFERLTLQDFKNYKGSHHLVLDRNPGVYFVKGENQLYPDLGGNGAGKSTLWDAMTWCLWGQTNRDSRPADSIHSWGKSKPNTQVSVFLKVKGESVEIRRQRKPNLLTIVQGSSERVVEQNEVSKLLGFNDAAFSKAVIMGQFGNMFLDLKPEQQSFLFNDILRLDEWVKASSAASEKSKSLRSTQEALAVDLRVALSLVECSQADLDSYKSDSNGWSKVQAAEQSKLKSQYDEAKKNYSQLLKAKGELLPLSDCPQSTAKIEVLDKELAEVNKTLYGVIHDIKAAKQKQESLKAAAVRLNDKKECETCGQPLVDVKLLKKLLKESEDSLAQVSSLLVNKLAVQAKLEKSAKKIMLSLADEKTKESAARKVHEQSQAAHLKQDALLEQSSATLDFLKMSLKSKAAQVNPFVSLIEKKDKILAETKVKVKDLTAELNKTEGLVHQVKAWSEGFKEIRLAIIDEVLSELEYAVAANAEALGLADWKIEFNTQKELTSGSMSAGFSVLLYPPDSDKPIKWESYSGGEAQRWQIATALGLSEVLLSRAGLSVNLLVLDEPTKGLSPEGVEALLESLKNRAESLSQVIFFCDHHSFDKGVFSGQVLISKTAEGSFIQNL